MIRSDSIHIDEAAYRKKQSFSVIGILNSDVYNELEASYVFKHKDHEEQHVVATKPAISATYLQENYTFNKIKSSNILKSSRTYFKKYYKPSPSCMKNYIFKRFPILDWIFDYDVKQNIIKDMIAGLTVNF